MSKRFKTHLSRQREKDRKAPSLSMFRTHVLESGVIEASRFPDAARSAPISFQFKLIVLEGGSGTIFTIGDSICGTACWVEDDATLHVVSGGGTGDTPNSVVVSSTIPVGVPVDVVVAVIPGIGTASVWFNGQLAAYGASPSGQLPSGLWASLGTPGKVDGV